MGIKSMPRCSEHKNYYAHECPKCYHARQEGPVHKDIEIEFEDMDEYDFELEWDLEQENEDD
jgi:hypothetical protein